MIEQLDQLADTAGFIRYQVRTFHRSSVVYVNAGEETPGPEEITGFSEEEAFSPDEVKTIAAAIREYNGSRKLNFNQMHFDF
ncbi:hypothetical protein LJ707_02020 [Mucilaginibacter sp. UR6-1]|uniref:hypothetical protein n=1 Tax=Mucilaginibacter sp. UR6-1 TaxID=1435643 RepID=UPI001E2ABD1C|nr:hypothetical protein [Mucilaginibacter sp. UR6-1]MCC8407687.1 hypothetical protein [Mucilaginibacter sp. UR6-1]